MAGSMEADTTVLISGGAVRDAAGVRAAPGAVAVRGGCIVAAGAPDDVRRAVGRPDRTIDRPDWLLIPGLINAHVHLQLTAIGPMQYTGRFAEWVTQLTTRWEQLVEQHTWEGLVRQSVAAGTDQTLAAGVLRVGDIAWGMDAAQLVRQSPLAGVAFIELLGIGGPTVDAMAERFEQFENAPAELNGTRLGLSPHAPFSTGPVIYQRAIDAVARHGGVLTTHLAEHAHEDQFVRDATGPRREQLEDMGKWDDAYLAFYTGHRSVVAWMEPYLRGAPWLCAHCNYVDDEDITLLAERDASVAYCPRASDYFGHRDHRYRDMLDAGVNVCLGTDSITCHGTLSVLDEMRHLYQRDRTDPDLLLKMATTHGMRGLQSDSTDATFAAGAGAGVVAVEYDPHDSADPLRQVLGRAEAPRIHTLIGLDTEPST